MDTTRMTLSELMFFHTIDRLLLYILLVKDLVRNPFECLQILGLWLWLEHDFYILVSKGEDLLSFHAVINRIYNLPPFLINEIADEAVLCLKCINNQLPSNLSTEAAIIPLTQNLVKQDISLQVFLDNRETIFHQVHNLVSDIYLPVLSDVMELARHGCFDEIAEQSPHVAVDLSSPDESLAQSLCGLSIGGQGLWVRARVQESELSVANRIMFVTFSKGYPVAELEVRDYFTSSFGECIESFYMQPVRVGEQALYAVVVFDRLSIIQIILGGKPKAKFNINGKHVWMRQFRLRGARGVWGTDAP